MNHITTWADYHPEVSEIFIRPSIDWPCELIETDWTPVFQPCIVKGPDEELFTAGAEGQVMHSRDLGRTWSLLGSSPPFGPEVPEGLTFTECTTTGIGVTEQGTILLVWVMSFSHPVEHEEGRREDESFQRTTWMTRTEDRGRTWAPTEPLDPSPFEVIGDQATLLQLTDGRLIAPFCVQAWARSGRPVAGSEDIFRSYIFSSTDDGRTWSRFSNFTNHSPEPDLLELPTGELLASIRYQRDKVPEDPPELAADARLYSPPGAPTDVGKQLFQHTAFSSSKDGGKTWATPRLVTASAQQSGSIMKLSDDTLVLTFGRYGQRFMLSYDTGVTWSRSIYQLNPCGQYARSIVLDDDTIITVHDNRETWNFRGRRLRCYDNSVVPRGEEVEQWGSGRLGILRWKVPSRQRVEREGFFTPREVESGSK